MAHSHRKENTPTTRKRYYVTRAQVYDPPSHKCILQDVALVGLHIVIKTRNRPQWIWSTFEHVDNVPPQGASTPPPNVTYSFNNPRQPQTLIPANRPPPVTPHNFEVNPDPMQVVRKWLIDSEIIRMNGNYKQEISKQEINGTVWQNYMLVLTQWPLRTSPERPTNNGEPFPNGYTNLANTTMETYFQDSKDGQFPSCMACHAYSNHYGRDFVMFVTMDAFRRGVRAPGDLFSKKTSDGPRSAANTLSRDPMLKSLMKYFEAAEEK
jgi:hypothetical protein